MKHVAFILYLILPICLQGQQLVDVIQNREYPINNYVKKTDAKQPYSKQSVEIVYANFIQEENWMKKFNISSEKICVDFLNQEEKYNRVLKDLNSAIGVYNNIKSTSAGSYYHHDIQYRDCNLESIHCALLGKWNQQILIEIKFDFLIPDHNDRSMPICYYYMVNTVTNAWEEWHQVLSQYSSDELSTQFWSAMTTAYIAASDKYDFRNKEYRDTAFLRQSKNNVSQLLKTKIKPKDILLLPFAWGILARMPDYCESSSCYNGEALQVFIPFYFLTEFLQKQSTISCLNPLFTTNTSLRNYYDFHHNLSKYGLLYQLNMDHLVQDIQPVRKPKHVTISRYQRFNDSTRKLTNKNSIEFNGKGRMLREKITDENERVISDMFLEMDENGCMLSEETIKQNDALEVTEYFRDKNNNVVCVQNTGKNEPFIFYFYHDNLVYRMYHAISGSPDRMNITSQSEETTSDALIHHLNTERSTKGDTKFAHRNDGSQYGYNPSGKLIESYSGNEQRCIFLIRDDKQRIKEQITYYQGEMNKHCRLFYKEDEELPLNMTERNSNYGNETILEYDIVWEYFN